MVDGQQMHYDKHKEYLATDETGAVLNLSLLENLQYLWGVLLSKKGTLHDYAYESKLTVGNVHFL